MSTIRQRYEEAHRSVNLENENGGCPICGGTIIVVKEENYYVIECAKCHTIIGEEL